MGKPSTFNKLFLYPGGSSDWAGNGYFGKGRIAGGKFQFTPSKLSAERGWKPVTAEIRKQASTNRKGESHSYGVVNGSDGAKYFIFEANFIDKLTGKKLQGYTVTIKLPKLKKTKRKGTKRKKYNGKPF